MFETEVTDHDAKVAVVEGKMEGLFRQMYVSCTQHSLSLHFKINSQLHAEVCVLWEELRQLMEMRQLNS